MSCCGVDSSSSSSSSSETGAAIAPATPLAWWRLVLGGVLAGNMMTVSLAINLAEATAADRFAIHLGLLTATATVLCLLGQPLLQGCWALVVTRRMDVEVLFVAALTGALAFSVYSTFVSGGPVYYEVVALLLAIYGISQRLKVASQQQIETLLARALLSDSQAQVVGVDGRTRNLALAQVQAGMLLCVHPGQPIVVDGVVERGTASVQTLSTTGEPFGRTFAAGDSVLATWICLDATLLVRATSDGQGREVDRIGASVRRHRAANASERAKPAPQTQRMVQRLVRWFAPLVMVFSSLTFVAWSLAAGLERGWLNGLSVLLVACPCALGFAVPLGLRLGVVRLARLGVEARSLAAVERMAQVRRMYFDKTGTLTQVAVDVGDVLLLPHAASDGPPVPPPLTAPQLFCLLQSAQRMVTHPIAAAFVARAQTQAPPWQVTSAEVVAGKGLKVMCRDGHGIERRLFLGEPDLLVEQGQRSDVAAFTGKLPSSMKPLAVCIDGVTVAVVALRERPFVEVASLFAALADEQISSEVLSGDTPQRVAHLGVTHVRASVSAVDKGQQVATFEEAGQLGCFVGDGFNDVAAMARATTCVAMADGTALTRGLADFVVPAGRPEVVLDVVRHCRATMRSVRANVVISVAYNLLGMGVAAAGVLTPVMAALLMLASSLTVSGRTLYYGQVGMRSEGAA